MEEYPVKVYIYDLSKGLARSMSMGFLGKQIDGIWHTGIVVFKQEFFFGGGGIESCAPGCLGIGHPDQVVEVGKSQVPFEVFMEYLQELSSSSYRPETYHLLEHNCNTFSNDLANFLTGNGIPSHITSLPQDVLNTPFGAMLRPMIDSMSASPSGGSRLFPTTQSNEVPKGGDGKSASASQGSSTTSKQPHTTDKRGASSSGASSPSIPKVTYMNAAKILEDYKTARQDLLGRLSDGDLHLLDDIHEYLSITDCSWGLGRQHLKAMDIAVGSEALPAAVKSSVMGLLQICLGKEDTIPLVSHDPNKTVLRFLYNFEKFDDSAKMSLMRGLCNCCLYEAGVEWLASSCSDSTVPQGPASDSVCITLCTTCLLSDNSELSSVGAGFTHSYTSQKKLNEEQAVDLGSALIQILQADLREQTASLCLHSLLKCIEANPEVCGIAAVMGLDISNISGKYPKLQGTCDHVADVIQNQ